MNSDDTDGTVYTVAFSDGKFLMVRNPRRNGWEMPGGHIKKGETAEEGAVREFEEEAGFSVKIIEKRNLGHCVVCAAELGERTGAKPEMECALFGEIPEPLAFDRAEYEEVIPWAAETLGTGR